MASIYCCLLCVSDDVALLTFTLAGVFELGHPMSLMGDETTTLQAIQQDLEQNSNRVQSLEYSTVWTSKFCKYGMEESRMLRRWMGSLGARPTHYLLSSRKQPPARSQQCIMNPFPLACSSARICVTHVSLGTAHQMLNLVKSNCYRKVYEQDSKNHSTHHRVQLLWVPPVWDLCNATDLRMVLNGPLFLPTLSTGFHPHPGPALHHLLSLTFPLLAIKLNFQAEELKLCFSPAHGPF